MFVYKTHAYNKNFIEKEIHICCKKRTNNKKSVKEYAYVLSKMDFAQHMSKGKCFAHSDLM